MSRKLNARNVALLILIIAVLGVVAAIMTRRSVHASAPVVKSNAAPQKPNTETVVFGTFRPGNLDIFYFSQRGEQPKRLTDDPGLDYDPVISPDGRWLIYT